MSTDVIEELGYLALGTRLKRLGERLQAQTQGLLEEAGIELPASHFPILAGLDRLGPLSVGEIAEAVGMSQPGVTRMLDKLQSDGWVKSTSTSGDRRVRTIALTAAGEKLVASSKRTVWPRIESAVADACKGRGESLLPALAALEESLMEASLSARADRLRTGEKTRARS
jgi:DNA-binding MarR family transcriptional regulator